MKRKSSTHHRPHGARPPEHPHAVRRAPAWLSPAIVYGVPVLAALWVHVGALGAYFTTDDLILLQRASGLAPFPETAWRWLSGQAYWRLLWPVFGAEPLGWHVVGWLLHGLATFLVAFWARRMGASRTVAVLAALLFGTTAKARTVVWQVTGVGESLAAVFTLLALALFAKPAPGVRRGATAWHAAALLSKESMGLAPLAALAGAEAPLRAAREWLRGAWPALALTAAVWGYVMFGRGSVGSLGGDAYAMGLGGHVLSHLFTYTLWSADPVHLGVIVPNPPTPAWAVAALGVLALLALFAVRSGSRPARAGLALWALALLPVLPLVHAVYEHYLYLPRAGFAIAVAAAVAALGGRVRAIGWAAAGFLAVVHGLTALMFLDAMATARIPQLDLPRDSFLRRMEISRNAMRSVRGRFPDGPVKLLVYTPPGTLKGYDTRTGAQVGDDSGYEFRQNMLQATLDQGRGLRVLEPAIREVRFTQSPGPDEAGWVLATDAGGGRIALHGPAPGAHAAMLEFWERMGYAEAAAQHRAALAALDSALVGAPAGAAAPAPPAR